MNYPSFRTTPFFICLSGVRVVHFVKLLVFKFLIPGVDVRCYFRVQNGVRFAFTPICFVGAVCLICVICIYLRTGVHHDFHIRLSSFDYVLYKES